MKALQPAAPEKQPQAKQPRSRSARRRPTPPTRPTGRRRRSQRWLTAAAGEALQPWGAVLAGQALVETEPLRVATIGMAILADAQAWRLIAARAGSLASRIAAHAVRAKPAGAFARVLTTLTFLGFTLANEITAERAIAQIVFFVRHRLAAPAHPTALAGHAFLTATHAIGAAAGDALSVVSARLTIDDARVDHASLLCSTDFHEFYAERALGPGESLSVTTMYFLFTDLCGSVSMYEALGDASAYSVCRQHFHQVAQIVTARGGAVVKTMGDAVVSVFPEPTGCLEAAHQIIMAAQNEPTDEPGGSVKLRLGMHGGRCLAVQANGTLDFYGRTVNIASRLESLSESGGLVISEEVAGEPKMAVLLEELSTRVVADAVKPKSMTSELQVRRVYF